jgi:hypothetical protein
MEAPPKGLNPVTDLIHLSLHLEGICVSTVIHDGFDPTPKGIGSISGQGKNI